MLVMEHQSHSANEKSPHNKFSILRIMFTDPKEPDHRKVIKMDTMTWYHFRDSGFEQTVNPVLKLLNNAECETLFNYYYQMECIIRNMNKENFDNSLVSMRDMTTRVFLDLHLDYKTLSYVTPQTFPFPDLTGVGTRAHDTKDMTFKLEDYIEVTSIQVICKLMAPVWGELFDKIKDKHNPLIGSDNREYSCSIIIEEFLRKSRFGKIYAKLEHYIGVTTESQLKYDSETKDTQFILSNNCVSLPKFKDMMIAMVLVKKFVSYNPFYNKQNPKDVPNIMSNVSTSVKESSTGRYKQWRQRADILPRHELKDITSNDNDNTSFLDHTSPASMITIDVAILNRLNVIRSVERYIKDNDIPEKLFNEAVDYYLLNGVSVSIYSNGLCASILTTKLGSSSKALKYIQIKEYVKIIVITQIWLLRFSDQVVDLVSFLTSDDTEISPDDIQNNSKKEKLFKYFNKNQVFENCKNMFPAQVHFSKLQETTQSSQTKKFNLIAAQFDTQLHDMVDWMASNTHRASIAPAIWKICNIKDHVINTSVVDVTSDTILNLCRVFIGLHSGEQ